MVILWILVMSCYLAVWTLQPRRSADEADRWRPTKPKPHVVLRPKDRQRGDDECVTAAGTLKQTEPMAFRIIELQSDLIYFNMILMILDVSWTCLFFFCFLHFNMLQSQKSRLKKCVVQHIPVSGMQNHLWRIRMGLPARPALHQCPFLRENCVKLFALPSKSFKMFQYVLIPCLFDQKSLVSLRKVINLPPPRSLALGWNLRSETDGQ